MNQEPDSLQRQLSINQNSIELKSHPTYGGFNADHDDGINVDDFLLQRKEESNYGKFHFFGLAIVFGAVGMMTSFQTETISDRTTVSTGMGLKGARTIADASCSMTDDACNSDDLIKDPTEINFFENIQQAFFLVLEALSALKFINYISFALSLTFLVLYLRPLIFG